jgi:hypothetical protein
MPHLYRLIRHFFDYSNVLQDTFSGFHSFIYISAESDSLIHLPSVPSWHSAQPIP